MAIQASKRLAGTAAAEDATRQAKKRKTLSTTAVPATADHGSTPRKQKTQKPAPTPPNKLAVVPATPGTRVGPLPTTIRTKKGADSAEANGGAPLKESRQGTRKEKQGKAQQNQPPSTLPTEPHAMFLSELQLHHDVRLLSVISSTKMEKRIKAVLEHLGGRQGQPATLSSTEPASDARPVPASGVVLLHARASDASKMISIVEIAKRRIREGCFGDAPAGKRSGTEDTTMEETTTKQTKKRKQKKRRAEQRQTAWYQYNRLYDVESVPSRLDVDQGDGHDDDDDDEFEPVPKQYLEALADKGPSTTTTYMSIVLSRVPLPVLERHPEITAQASGDTLETEYQSWISNMT